MPYALFSHAEQVSKAFPTKSDVWRHAAERGLVIELGSREEDPPRRILDIGYAISKCEPDTAGGSDASGISERGIAQLVAASSSNPPSAAAAS